MATNIQDLKQQGGAATEESPLASLLRMPFSPEAWHAMNARDDMQVQSEILHGAASAEFVYAMIIQGQLITGVGVTGARQLAIEYGGIKSRLVASTEKKGSLFIFRQFYPLVIQTANLPELATQEDFYEAVVEVSDIKTGNSITVRKSENQYGKGRNGRYEKQHFDTIAESKAHRNGVLSLVPQDTTEKFKIRCLSQGIKAGAFDAQDDDTVKLKAAIQRYLAAAVESPQSGPERTMDQLRDGCLRFAAKSGTGIDKTVLMNLTYEQLFGLGEAAKGTVDAFRVAAVALGLLQGEDTGGKTTTANAKPADKTPPPPRSRRVGSGSGSAIE